jgi:hypothetical protein
LQTLAASWTNHALLRERWRTDRGRKDCGSDAVKQLVNIHGFSPR